MHTRFAALLFTSFAPAILAQGPHSIFRLLEPRPVRALAAGADLDGDGVPDQVVAVQTSNGTIMQISGRTGIARSISSGVPDRLGDSIAMLSDLDRDGGAEFVLGAPGDATHGADAGAVYVLSGRTNRRLVRFLGISPGDAMGSCANLADLDADGTPEFAIAAPGSDFPTSDAGAVYVISGRGFAVLRSHVGTQGQRLGEHMLDIEDQDRDGVRDYVLSVRGPLGNGLEVMSGRTGQRLFSVTLPLPAAIDSLSDAGDIDNDGRTDVAVGLVSASPPSRGAVILAGNGFGIRLSLGNLIGRGVAAVGDFDGDGHGGNGGDGGDGFYRVESPVTQITNAQPLPIPDNVGALLDRDAQAGQQSMWYGTGSVFFARFVRFEIDAVRNGVNVVYSDDANVGLAPTFGDASAPLWFKLQGGRLNGGAIDPGSEGPWRDRAIDVTGDRADAFRFVLLRNDPQVRVLRVRVLVSD